MVIEPGGERIRIAYILPADVRGGVEEHVLSLIRNIDRERFQPFLVAPPRLADSLAADLEPGEATILRLRINSLKQIGTMLAFFRFLRRHRIRIVNTHMFIATFYYAPIARLAGVPVVMETTHLMEKWRLDKGFFRRNSFIIDRLFYCLLDKVLAVSHSCKEELIRIKRIPAERIVVVHNGRDLASFDPACFTGRAELRRSFGFDEDDCIFGLFARLNFQKGHKYLLEALRLLKTKGKAAKLLLVGDGELRNDLEELAGSLEVRDQITFAGFRKNVPELLSIIDVKVLPSLYEGLPLCVIEALAMEKPVIATSVDGTPEIVHDRENGLLVPPRDPQALADAMEYALDHRREMEEMGKRGREFVIEHFSLKGQIEKTEAVYLELCRRHAC